MNKSFNLDSAGIIIYFKVIVYKVARRSVSDYYGY